MRLRREPATLQYFKLTVRRPPGVLDSAAEAYAGMGDLYAAQAGQASDDAARSKLRNDSRTSYQKSQEVWKQIPNPSRTSGSGYAARDPHEVARRLGHLP